MIATIASGSGYTISGTAGSATGTITDDDATPVASISVSTASVLEDGSTNLVYTVTLDHAASVDTVVNVGWSGTAAAGDFSGTQPATVTILAGQTTGSSTVTIDPTDRKSDEQGKTVVIGVDLGGGRIIKKS